MGSAYGAISCHRIDGTTMASITLGKYRIQSDTYGWVVGEVGTRKKKDEAGHEIEVEAITNPRYPATLVSALNWLLNERLRASNASTVSDLRDEILAFRQEVAALLEVGPPGPMPREWKDEG